MIPREQDKIQKVTIILVAILASLLLMSILINKFVFPLPQSISYFQFFATIVTVLLVDYVDPIYCILVKMKGTENDQKKKSIIILLNISFALFLVIVILLYKFLFLSKNYLYIIILCIIIYSLLSYFIKKLTNKIKVIS